jgi:heptosyltransferase III
MENKLYFTMRTKKNILIVRTDRIGDVVLTLPMIYMIKKNEPESDIFFMARKYTMDLLEGNDKVKKCLIYDKTSSYRENISNLKKLEIDMVFIASPSFKLAFILFMASIPVRIGTGYRWYSFFFNRKVFEHRKYAENHELEFNLNLLKSVNYDTDGIREFNIPILKSDEEKVDRVLENENIQNSDTIVILHPGSGGSAMDLPKEKIIELSNLLLENNIKLILTGGKGEENLINEISSRLKGVHICIVNKFNLREYACLCKKAKIFISNSTGPIHIAAAVGTFVAGFYPPIIACSEKRWGPYTDRKLIFTPDLKEKCIKCTKSKCIHYNCMDKISIPKVYIAIKEIINN